MTPMTITEMQGETLVAIRLDRPGGKYASVSAPTLKEATALISPQLDNAEVAAKITALESQLTQASLSLIEAQREREELRADAERWRRIERERLSVMSHTMPHRPIRGEGPWICEGVLYGAYGDSPADAMDKHDATKARALAPTERTNG